MTLAGIASVDWYIARATGIVSLLLFTGVVVLGLLTSMNWKPARLPSFVVQALHRSVSLASMVFLGLHVVTIAMDDYVSIDWIDTVIPFISDYSPFWLGMGAIAIDLLLLLVVTSLLRERIGVRVWRALHWSAYLCWPVAVTHGLMIGTDSRTWWMLALYGVELLTVASVLTVRIVRGSPRRPQPLADAVLASQP